MFVGCEANPECFPVAEETVLKQIAKAALVAGTDVKLSWRAAQAAARVSFLVPEIAIVDPR